MALRMSTENNMTLYEILALPASQSKTIFNSIMNPDDDQTDRIQLRFICFIGMTVVISRKHPRLEDVEIIANGTAGSIVGFAPSIQNSTCRVTKVEGAVIYEVQTLPELILVRVHDCQDTLVNGFPPGVIGIPALNAQVKLKHVKYVSRSSITVQLFAIVPGTTFSCKTCKDGITVTTLERLGVRTQSEYVALLRTIALNKLTLTEEITPEYIANFKPPHETITECKDFKT
ncbi:hypothetical protein JG688_00014493 [Phytophthora aleatoria]|uniref:Uncharacterized protein n=1 Tax=Phytophthora aleatoria TaxID=2496075 RepID=A0A8J5M391_9STRA|nr:hypothetical protein JG688_00014493 [Phytophthora aleatoria]